MLQRFAAALIALTLLVANANAQGPRARNYPAYSLQSLEDDASEGARVIDNPEPGLIFAHVNIRAQVRATYQGESRDIGQARLDVIRAFAQMARAPAGYAELYRREFLFRADGREYWLPVQAEIAPFLDSENRTGKSVTLYVVRAGGRLTESGWDWLFLVQAFE